MKYIKTFEELKPETYISAADKLSKLGHIKRPEQLKNYAYDTIRLNTTNSIKTIGEFEIVLSQAFTKDVEKKYTGKYYIFLHLDKDDLYSSIQDYKEDYSNSIYLPLDIALVPIDEDSEKIVSGFDDVYYNKTKNAYFVSRITIKLTKGYKNISDAELYELGIKKPINVEDLKNELFPDGKFDIEITHDVDFSFLNRYNANKFKKALNDIFSGAVDYKLGIDNLDGLKDEVFDVLSDNGFDLGSIFRFIDSLKKININQLYLD